jgi:hypothetical protein
MKSLDDHGVRIQPVRSNHRSEVAALAIDRGPLDDVTELELATLACEAHQSTANAGPPELVVSQQLFSYNHRTQSSKQSKGRPVTKAGTSGGICSDLRGVSS